MPLLPVFRGDFTQAFADLLSPQTGNEIFAAYGPRGGGSPKLSGWQWLMGKVFHVMAGAGNFAHHVKQITGIPISDSALSQRGASLGWERVAVALRHALRPLADPNLHPDAFHQGLRLIALDGTRFNLRNTAAIKQQAVKSPCAKGGGEPAFAHLCGVVLVELASHQPLAATFGWHNQGELTLARELLATHVLPPASLLLGDRLFGTPCFIHELLLRLQPQGGGVLLRVRRNLNSRVLEILSDGSRLVEVDVNDAAAGKFVSTLRLREIHAEILLKDGSQEAKPLRLWTSLLDEVLHPAVTLAELYAQRWEHELFYRELKTHLRIRGNLLDGQTPQSAAQEALALLLAAALLAGQRMAVAQTVGVAVKRISFTKVLAATVALCRMMEIGGDLIDEKGRAEWVRRILEELRGSALIPLRKPRSCSRGLRQPSQDWPKIRCPTSKPLLRAIRILPNP